MSSKGWWEPGSLEGWRQVGDPLADAVVKVLADLKEKPQMESSLGFVERMAGNDGLSAAERKPLRAFLDAVAEPPDWLDWGAVLRGQTFFVRFGIVHSTALLLGGLLESYSDTQIANVLMRTGRLKKGTYRRIFETGQMVYDAMIPDGLREGRRGFARARTCKHSVELERGEKEPTAREHLDDREAHPEHHGQARCP